MHSDLALRLMSDLLWTGLLLCAPVLIVAMTTGLLVSLIQVVTQIQEMSLSFVPKLLATGIGLIIFGPWMLKKLSQYTTNLWGNIPLLFQ
ncbi:flagellar biosynthesis protein FliQ [Acidovorax facilis]|uniref:flagellar biosynthesis protein FliQ n=1 Tax=Acidovorax facilis TaxID=12917 RepID=UPI003CF9E778